MSVSSTSAALAARLLSNLSDPLQSAAVSVRPHLDEVLRSCGASVADTGGSLSISGADPIIPSRLPFGTMSAVGLAAKAVMMAKAWRVRTGIGQDIHVDVPLALRRFSPFAEGKWELVNGFPGKADPYNPFGSPNPLFHRTKDEQWMMLLNIYPAIRERAVRLLGAGGSGEAIAEAVAQWNGADLEEAAAAAGVVGALARPVAEVVELPAFTDSVGGMPLISIEKVADGDPVPFAPNARSPLDGVRALGTAHVIAGPSIGRGLALHGADVLNVWRPSDVEQELFHYTSHVGTRSTTLEIADAEQRATFLDLASTADVFYSNRRPGWRERFGISADELRAVNPGLIDVQVLYAGESGPWSDRVGFDISAGAAWGLNNIEGTDSRPEHPPIYVICDYVVGWLATAGAVAALLRRATEGGSYRVRVSLSRCALWLPEMGVFDRDFARSVAGSGPGHIYPDPEQFTVETPLGTYTGVSETVRMSATPGAYAYPLTPLGSWKPSWL
ncbi:CoA transferase [Tsukamurella strandjordii]|nr:carnitine dehydratase [Tsukamurella sp. TY48]